MAGETIGYWRNRGPFLRLEGSVDRYGTKHFPPRPEHSQRPSGSGSIEDCIPLAFSTRATVVATAPGNGNEQHTRETLRVSVSVGAKD